MQKFFDGARRGLERLGKPACKCPSAPDPLIEGPIIVAFVDGEPYVYGELPLAERASAALVKVLAR